MDDEGCVEVTLQSRGDGLGGSEVPAGSGADPSAVQGTSTLMRPERTTGLRTQRDTVGTYRPKEFETSAVTTW